MFGYNTVEHWTRIWAVRLFYTGVVLGLLTVIEQIWWVYNLSNNNMADTGMWIMMVLLCLSLVTLIGSMILSLKYEMYVQWYKKERVKNFARILRGE